jgi:hypothetical protein
MNQVLSKEEVAALFEGLLEAEADFAAKSGTALPAVTPRDQVSFGRQHFPRLQAISTWLNAIRRWWRPHA